MTVECEFGVNIVPVRYHSVADVLFYEYDCICCDRHAKRIGLISVSRS